VTSSSGSADFGRVRAHRLLAILAGGALLFVDRPAAAQSRTGFAVSRFEPSERGAGWFVVDALDLRGNARPALGVTLDYAFKPLAVYDSDGNERLALVRHQLFVHAGGSLVIAERLRLALNLPIAAYQDGDSTFASQQALKGASTSALGDVRLAADVRIAGRHGDALTLALGVRGWLPTGVRSQFTGDGSARIGPQVLASGELGVFAWATRLAIAYRSRDDEYAGTPLGSELSGAAGAGVRAGRFFFGPEVFASTAIAGQGAFLSAHRTPADAILGVRCELTPSLRIAAAGGSGLTRGFGSPAFRALASVEWTVPIPVGPRDRDQDGVADPFDACPEERGVASGDPELNGCPAPEPIPREDTDADGIWDSDDACPGIRGIQTSDAMTNGCPPGTPRPLAVVTTTEIRIGDEIRFATGSADLLEDGAAVLPAVKQILDQHPEIRRLRVEGHTDDTGDPSYNDELSLRRASAVVHWLTEHGVEASRLASEGFGSKKPIATNLTEEGRAKNRRVAFTILERSRR
jgi:OOP family OmpA-OmpF porin